MAALAAELLEAELVTPAPHAPPPSTKALSLVHRRSRQRHAGESCLMICADPSDLNKVLNIGQWRKRFEFLAAWVIDSFWLERIPSTVRFAGIFDHFFVTSLEDVDAWRKQTRVPTTWLPWGTDALRLGGGGAARHWDIRRVGRQPPEWDEDGDAAKAALSLGMRYGGRPGRPGSSSLENFEFLMQVYRDSKYILAFSNSVNPESYTHPSRQYLTGRWVDALAGGAVVAGIAPRGPGTDSLLWPGATLELGTVQRAKGLQVLAHALKHWNPGMAAKNHAMSLKLNDWRWRFKVLADVFETAPAPLHSELALLQERIEGPHSVAVAHTR